MALQTPIENSQRSDARVAPVLDKTFDHNAQPNLARLLLAAADRFQERGAFATRGADRVFRSVSFGTLFREAQQLAAVWIELGLRPREHVALFADNRYEWILCDLSVILCGAADVPRAADVTEDETRYILEHADCRFAIVENEAVLGRLLRCRSALPKLERIIVIDRPTGSLADSRDVLCLADLRRSPSTNGAHARELKNRLDGIRGDDLFTLIYTSGTTGKPKGVQLTHANIVSQIVRNPFRIGPEDRILSILPVWHIFERVFEMFALANGCCTYYTSVRTLREDLALVRPTFMASAPRLWESVYQGIRSNVEKAPPLRRALFALASGTAARFRHALRVLSNRDLRVTRVHPLLRLARYPLALVTASLLWLPFVLLDAIVLRKVRRATGGLLRGSVSGGGALPLHVDTFFNDIGIPVLEGYGLTETSPVLAVRTFEKLVIGTVGPLYPDTELRLVDLNDGSLLYPGSNGLGRSGEIHVRGPQVMKGYYKDPTSTARVLRDGWFNTGDLGVMTSNGCLKIVGRSKDTIVLLGGENVEPVPIENKLQESPLIEACMVVGQDRKFLGALIVPRREAFAGASLPDIATSDEARQRILKEVKRLVSQDAGFKAFERVIDLRLLPKAFEPGDELTAKLSLKRHLVTERYAKLIESIYSD